MPWSVAVPTRLPVSFTRLTAGSWVIWWGAIDAEVAGAKIAGTFTGTIKAKKGEQKVQGTLTGRVLDEKTLAKVEALPPGKDWPGYYGTDSAFRERAVAKLQDQELHRYWNHEFKNYTPSQRTELTVSTLTKVGQLLKNPMQRHIFGQEKSRFDPRPVTRSASAVTRSVTPRCS